MVLGEGDVFVAVIAVVVIAGRFLSSRVARTMPTEAHALFIPVAFTITQLWE